MRVETIRAFARAAGSSLSFAALALAGSAQNTYQPLIDRWVSEDALDPPPAGGVLFLGSSSVRLWEHLSRDFADWDVIQRGFGGSTWDDANQFVDEIVLPYGPSAIFVYEGSNDITQGTTPQAAFDDFLQFVSLVRDGTGELGGTSAPIVHVALAPAPGLWSTWPEREEYNSLVQAYAEGDPTVHYADVATPFLATGSPPSEHLFSPDLVHLNEAGYGIWTDVLRPLLQTLVPAKGYAPNPEHPPIGARLLFDFGPSNAEDGQHVEGPDPFGSLWNNWLPLVGLTSSTQSPELAGQVFAGEHVGNLVTTSGARTGIDLVITGGFFADGKQSGGLLNPSPALLGRFAVAPATMDFFNGTDHTAPAGLMLRGLRPELDYDFRFFGSRAALESLTTVYGVRGHGPEEFDAVPVSGIGIGGGGTYNGNDDTVAEILRVRPDEHGQAFVDFHGAPGEGTPSTVNSMELWVRPRRPDAYPTGPTQHP